MKKLILICSLLICGCGTGDEFSSSSPEFDSGPDSFEAGLPDSKVDQEADVIEAGDVATKDSTTEDVVEDTSEDVVEDVVVDSSEDVAEDTVPDVEEVICVSSTHCDQFEVPEVTGCTKYPYACLTTVVCTQGVEVISTTSFSEAPFASCTTLQYLGEEIFCCDESCAPIKDNSVFDCVAPGYEQYACYWCPQVALEGVLEQYQFTNCEMQDGCSTTKFVNGSETWWGVCCN